MVWDKQCVLDAYRAKVKHKALGRFFTDRKEQDRSMHNDIHLEVFVFSLCVYVCVDACMRACVHALCVSVCVCVKYLPHCFQLLYNVA